MPYSDPIKAAEYDRQYRLKRRKSDPEFAKRQRGYCKKWSAANRARESARSKRYRQDNIEKMREYENQRSVQRRAKNPERQKAANRRSLLKKYGLSALDYTCMLTEQNFVCKSCGEPEVGLDAYGNMRPLSVDHDHVTGEVRGLLCNGCNRALGFINDSSEKLKKLISYLDSARKIC
jgi:hypothetical protein